MSTAQANADREPGGAGRINRVGMVSRARQDEWFAREGVDALAEAFERKRAVHAGMGGGAMLKGAEAQAAHARLMERPRQGKSTVYVHVPFCETKCIYCGFYIAPYKEELGAAYVDALLEEMRQERDLPGVGSQPVHAVYLGGGTPTALEPRDLERLLAGIRQLMPLANDCEITVEGRIHNFGPEKRRAAVNGGANRFSLGVQTFHTGLRRALGRVCDRELVLRTLEDLLALDTAAVIIDLIYGLPGQTMASWEEDLRTFEALGLDGCDLYQLNVFPGGKLDQALKSGAAAPVADIPMQSRMFRRGVELMTDMRASRLSISHWGRGPRERNIYNPLMKGRADCLAYGAGAGGSLHGHFCFMTANLDEFMSRRAAGEKPLAGVMPPPDDLGLMRSLSAQLERGWLDLDRAGREAGFDAGAEFDPLLRQWERAGLLSRRDHRIDLTLAGQFWQVNLVQGLLDWHKHNRKEESI